MLLEDQLQRGFDEVSPISSPLIFVDIDLENTRVDGFRVDDVLLLLSHNCHVAQIDQRSLQQNWLHGWEIDGGVSQVDDRQ